MSNTTMTCSCCGCLLAFDENATIIECPACGTRNARPTLTGENLLTLQRATEQRLASDFHNAELSYQQVLLYRPDAHEALWGRLLCHYGVEYVEDPATRRRMPTVHTVQAKPLQTQPDFIKACRLAPDIIRKQYELDAVYIDDAQADIRQKAKSCQPYDVFLCHKTTKPGSTEKTADYQYALDVYHELDKLGVRVFFAPRSLTDAAGANYEAGIYHALHTAKVMLLFCTQADYLTSPWVRSEWTRFLNLIEADEANGGESERKIIPLFFDHFNAYDLPQQFLYRSTQGIDMAAFGASQKVLDIVTAAVKPVVTEEPESEPVPEPEPEPVVEYMTEHKSVVEEVKPEPVPSPKSKYSVTLSFPGLQKKWTTVPEWYIYKADMKTCVADIQWNSTIEVPIDAERTQLFYGSKPTKFGSVIMGALLLVVALITAGIAFSFNIIGGEIAIAALFAVAGIVLLCLPARPQMYGNIIVTAGKSYDLTWPWLGGCKFKVEEY